MINGLVNGLCLPPIRGVQNNGVAKLLGQVGMAVCPLEDALENGTSMLTSPMCGNSICQDRRFMARWMPKLESYFHYRNLDVSTLKELVRRWKPEVAKGMAKHNKHEALADILESIEELKYYRKTVMTI